MALLHEIQQAVVKEAADLGSVLLKLRYLASRLGSGSLEDWVMHEAEGYPSESQVPEYRKVPVTFRGTFSGPFGSGIRNAQIPPYLIQKHAGERWLQFEVRESIAAIEGMINTSNESDSHLGVDASHLILPLQNKVFSGYNCIGIDGRINEIAIVEIQQAVRNRVLELTIELEKAIPVATEVNFGGSYSEAKVGEAVGQIAHQVVYGNQTTIIAGPSSSVTLAVSQGDAGSFVKELAQHGVPEEDAVELVALLGSEEAESEDEPFGKKAREWVATNLKKAADGTWKIGISAASKLLTEAALRFYGLK